MFVYGLSGFGYENCCCHLNIKSTFEEIKSRASQGSVLSPVLFNIVFNDFFYFILVASAHNFADGNTFFKFY